jgi:ubiquinone/menaquinone biosynthesis C-methylase UbiE
MTTEAGHGWQVVGSSSDAYERFLVPTIFEPWAGVLLDHVDPQPGERLLDVACGTGVVARTAAARVLPAGSVTGIDVNADMLDTARQAAGADAATEWRQADALDLPFPEASFDVVVCQQGLQFVSDRAAMVRETRRVLAGSGRLAMSTWRGLEHNRGFAQFAQALERHSAEAGSIMRTPFALGDQDELRRLLREAGFDHVRALIEARVCRFPSPAELLRYETLASPLAAPLAQLDAASQDRLGADVEDALASYVDDDGLAIPMECHVILAS